MNNETITIKVSYPAWSESPSSWHLLINRSPNGIGWSGGVWFPKSVCTLVKHDEQGVGLLTMPLWLYKKKLDNEGNY